MPAPHLSIGTATDRIDLLSGAYTLKGWEVGDTDLDMIFQESQLADYRQMAAYRDITAIETFELVLKTDKQDQAARKLQRLRAMLRKMADYWSTTWQTEVVYIAARASCETNIRYAVVVSGKLVGESDPFNQPFLQGNGNSVMDSLALIVERRSWLGDIPGTGTCVEISSQGPDLTVCVLDFDGDNDDVNFGSDASLDDLPSSGNMTAEAWINADDWGENDYGRIFSKQHSAAGEFETIYYGWELYLEANQNRGIRADAYHATTDAMTWTGTDDFMPDQTWHHVAAVWTLASKEWDIAIDGVWVTTTKTAGAGAYRADAADDLICGNNSAGSATFDGSIGWVRISSSIRYTVGIDFTPPDRCIFPTTDGDTELLAIHEGYGATATDASANGNDGTITGATWLWSGCETEYMEATCDAKSVFAANKHNVAQITHAYYWDDSAAQWTDGGAPPNNLIGDATPYAFLPAAPAVDDFVIFGISTTLDDSGPFCSLVFDIGTAIGVGTGLTIQWRYKATGDADDPGDGVNPWSALTVQDNTNASGGMTGDAFDTTGIGSVHWEQPSDWETSNPNPGAALGVTGYWVCAYITAVVGGAPTPPTQDNRDIYTVTWPYIDITADEITGDMPALLRLSVDTRSAQDAVPSTTNLWSQRIMAGLRSCDRGDNFSAFINLADEQLPAGTDVTLGGGTAFAAWIESPTGRAACYTSAPADTMDVRAYVALSSDWYGRFHAFVRCYQDDAGTVQVRLEYPVAESGIYIDRKTVTRTIYTQDADVLLDFGEIVIGPAADIAPYEMASSYVNIEAFETVGSVDVYFYDLILIPVDEWAFDSEDMLKNANDWSLVNGNATALNMDGIQNARNLLSHLYDVNRDMFTRHWRPITNGLPILQTGKHQRLWFLASRFDDYADADDERPNHEICHSVQVWKNQRYTTLRGDQ